MALAPKLQVTQPTSERVISPSDLDGYVGFFLCFWDPKNVFQTRSSGSFAWVSSECQFQLCTKAASVTGKAAFSFSSKLELKKQIKKG